MLMSSSPAYMRVASSFSFSQFAAEPTALHEWKASKKTYPQVEIGAIAVEELHLLGFKANRVELGASVEGVVNYATSLDVAELGANECTALARLNMLEFNDRAELVVVLDAHAITEKSAVEIASLCSFKNEPLQK